jgi:hypothetical protein
MSLRTKHSHVNPAVPPYLTYEEQLFVEMYLATDGDLKEVQRRWPKITAEECARYLADARMKAKFEYRHLHTQSFGGPPALPVAPRLVAASSQSRQVEVSASHTPPNSLNVHGGYYLVASILQPVLTDIGVVRVVQTTKITLGSFIYLYDPVSSGHISAHVRRRTGLGRGSERCRRTAAGVFQSPDRSASSVAIRTGSVVPDSRPSQRPVSAD